MNEKTYLDDQIARLYNRMAELDPESKEYAAVEENWTKMMQHKLEIIKHESSEAQVEKQMKADFKDRVVRYVIEGAKIVLPLGVTVMGTLLAYTFEEKGTISSRIGQKFMDKLTKY